MEKIIADALDYAGIEFQIDGHPLRRDDPTTLDFKLVDHDIYIEVKRMHTLRSDRQLAQAENVILVQGKDAVEWLAARIHAWVDHK